MKLTEAQSDRAVGAIVGTAVADALGAHYEFDRPRLGADEKAQMLGGGLGPFAPGEWTDDTTMAWCILDAARGLDLRTEEGLTAVAHNFRTWAESDPKDIGNQTARVLDTAGPAPTAAQLQHVAEKLHEMTGHTGGNGSLMRTAPVPLRYLGDRAAVAEAAAAVSALTHWDEHARSGCALWSLAIEHAVMHGELDVRSGLSHLSPAEATFWTEKLDEAETEPPSTFNPNGWVVTALQAAWSSIAQTPATGPEHYVEALNTAIRIGNDTDTVAAIAGGLLGARWGASAIPADWRALSHGYPGIPGDALATLALDAVAAGRAR
ncbi:ADP-ribosylglycohydrolase [Nocardioides sp. YR527]|uniref:ADP-ribosylglycohydrolase family protein n=1 Tax=Nocardioides sp. YR527 TaxID=1881028 RepID=UPI00087F4FEE|nr:ADP-ribosylglycohydrolase family protein [Nocardioides sp. YR527]SDK34664.1 ADP-ribosylglycohydrolase [Nocardioides sp. YR527]